MANSQTIEARLCAYIDGDLDEAERIGIERHLEAHPQHRAMISDLIKMRRLVGNLPHVAAPADLGEGLQGQIERSMLLDEDDPEPGPLRARLRRSRHLVVMAAVLFLAAGLSWPVYQILKGASKPPNIAIVNPPLPLLDDSPATKPFSLLPIPDTQPIQAAFHEMPDTQPDAIAEVPTTEPSVMSDIFAVVGDELGVDDLTGAAPATQPAPIAAAQPPATEPTTLPVADDGDEK